MWFLSEIAIDMNKSYEEVYQFAKDNNIEIVSASCPQNNKYLGEGILDIDKYLFDDWNRRHA